jgi:hypothetical protein
MPRRKEFAAVEIIKTLRKARPYLLAETELLALKDNRPVLFVTAHEYPHTSAETLKANVPPMWGNGPSLHSISG